MKTILSRLIALLVGLAATSAALSQGVVLDFDDRTSLFPPGFNPPPDATVILIGGIDVPGPVAPVNAFFTMDPDTTALKLEASSDAEVPNPNVRYDPALQELEILNGDFSLGGESFNFRINLISMDPIAFRETAIEPAFETLQRRSMAGQNRRWLRPVRHRWD